MYNAKKLLFSAISYRYDSRIKIDLSHLDFFNSQCNYFFKKLTKTQMSIYMKIVLYRRSPKILGQTRSL